MVILPLWKDILDEDALHNNGKFFLYRHRLKVKRTPQVEAVQKQDSSIDNPKFVYLRDPKPIACGFSAFLFYGLPRVRSFYEFHNKFGSSYEHNFGSYQKQYQARPNLVRRYLKESSVLIVRNDNPYRFTRISSDGYHNQLAPGDFKVSMQNLFLQVEITNS